MKKKLYLKFSEKICDHCNIIIKNLLEKLYDKDISIHFKDDHGEIELSEKIHPETIAQIIQTIPHKVIESKIEEIQESLKKTFINTHRANHQYDLIILGGGSSAFSAAIKASEWNKKVLMVNDGLPIGGTCVNVGCIPSKILIRTAEQYFYANHPNFKAIKSGNAKLDFKETIQHTREIVQELRKQKYLDVLKDNENVTILKGYGTLIDPHTVKVHGETFTGKYILIATGSSTYIPSIPGLDSINYLTNETLYELEELPEHLIIIGGRYIALENAQSFARFGSKVTILQRSRRILPDELADISETLKTFLEQEGITVVTNTHITSLEKRNNKIIVHALVDNKEEVFEGSHLFLATGRKGNIDKLNLESIGIEVYKNDFIKTNEYLQTTVPNIYAAGDVTGEYFFVYAAAYEGALAVENIFNGNKKKKDYSIFPWVIFTDPQVAGVGIDEKQATILNINYEVSKTYLSDVPRSIVGNNTNGFIKLIRNKENDELIGARILAHEGSELIMQLSLAMKYKINIKELKEMFYPYLTLSEGIKLSAIGFDKDINKLSCCAF